MAPATLALLRTQSDARLAALARDGHERAFEAIVERYRRELLRHGQRVLGEARAEDVVQQALLAAWAALRRGDDVRDLRPWLHRIVQNAALNTVRGGRDEYAELRESMQVGGAPDEELERRLIVRETLAALAGLPERQREALLRVAVEGRSQEEVANAFGLSHGAVRQLVHRARTALRAAATAVTPLPVASWLASAGARAEPVGARIAELVGDSGAAGISAALAKGAAMVALAGSFTAGPGLVRHSSDRQDAAEAADVRLPAPRHAPPGRLSIERPSGELVGRAGTSRSGTSGSGRHAGESHDSDSDDRRSGSSGHGSGEGDSGSSEGSPGSSGSGSGESGSGSSGSGSSGSGSSGSGSGESGSGSSGSGSGSSGSGSGSSGSGSGESGHGGSGSGSSGSGSGESGSGSSGSGSGSSGSGSDGSAPATSVSSSSGSGSSGSGSGDSGSDSSGSGSGGSGSDSSGSGSGSGSGSDED